MIAIDWGTSNFRAYRLDGRGQVIERHQSDQGILAITDGDFEAALDREIGSWLAHEHLMLLCGMIGSRQGWHETGYVPCPAGLDQIRQALVPVPLAWHGRAWLVPGVSTIEGMIPDLMRGEEAQILGALGTIGAERALICLPGTHSKWARVAAGKIERFETHMTGESYALYRHHSILGRLMPPVGTESDPDDLAFAAGLARAHTRGGLLHHLFAVRSLRLTEALAATALPAYLSGLLIGHELAASVDEPAPVFLIGEAALVQRYALALSLSGREAIVMAPDRAADGLFRLAQGH